MKQLLGMARQKKEKQGPKPAASKLQLKAPPKAQYEMSQDSDPEYEQYQITEEQLIGYAQFLGIKLPQQQDLLWIAEQGLTAELPQGWAADDTSEDGQIIYTNLRTGQKSYQHPCDHYYQQLVIQQRRKKGGVGSKLPLKKTPAGPVPIKSIQQTALPLSKNQPKSTEIDPLVKMQQEKAVKKLQEQKRKQYEQKKNNLKARHQSRKDQLMKQLNQKQEKASQKYRADLQAEKQKQNKKMSEDERKVEQKMAKQMKQFQADARRKVERNIEDKRQRDQQRIDEKIRQKTDELKKQLQAKLRKDKKQVDQQFRLKAAALDEKERQLKQQGEGYDKLLEDEINALKKQIIRKKMREHGQKIKVQNQKQKEHFNREMVRLQAEHDQRVAALQKKQPKNRIKMQQLIAECERKEKEEMQAFGYELQHLKRAKEFQMEQRLQSFKGSLMEQHQRAIQKVIQQYDEIYQKYKNVKDQQYQAFVWQAQRKSKEEYLRSLKSLQKKFQTQQEVAIMQGTRVEAVQQKQRVEGLERIIEQLNWEERQARGELEAVRLQIDNLRSQASGVGGRLNASQMKLYQLIQDKIRQGA